MKKFISLFLCLALALTMPLLAADDDTNTIGVDTVTVSLRIEGISENLATFKDTQVIGKAGELTVADAVRALVGEEHYVEVEGEYGAYFTSIYGEEEGMGAYGGWNYRVNGESPAFSMDQYVLQGGEDIVVYYGDLNTLYPIVKVEDGILTLTAKSWQEGEDGEWTEVEAPISGVTVYWAGEDIGTTDSAGVMVLPQEQPGDYSLQIRKDGAAVEGSEDRFVPAVVRLAADTVVTVTEAPAFSDLPRDHRAYNAVMALYEAGIVSGNGDGTFGTEDTLTRAEAAVMLFRLAGSPVTTEVSSQVQDQNAWYYHAANWAFSLNIFQREGVFEPNAAVTGGELASYIAIYSEESVTPPRDLMHDPISRGDAAIMLAELL